MSRRRAAKARKGDPLCNGATSKVKQKRKRKKKNGKAAARAIVWQLRPYYAAVVGVDSMFRTSARATRTLECAPVRANAASSAFDGLHGYTNAAAERN